MTQNALTGVCGGGRIKTEGLCVKGHIIPDPKRERIENKRCVQEEGWTMGSSLSERNQ